MAGLIERHMLRPFVWGETDCCLTVCNILRDKGWLDPAAGFRGHYHDEAGAREIIGDSPETVIEQVCAERGWPEIDPETAQDDDIGICAKTLMIRSDGAWVGKSLNGAIVKKRVRRAWRPA